MVLWPDANLSTFDPYDANPENLRDHIFGLDPDTSGDFEVTFIDDAPVIGGGPSAPPPPPQLPSSSSFPPARLVDPDDENGRHFFTHIRTILGATEHAARCTDYIAGSAGTELQGAFLALSNILRWMDFTPIDPLTASDPRLIQVVKNFLLQPPEKEDVSMNMDDNAPSDADPTPDRPVEVVTPGAAAASAAAAPLAARAKTRLKGKGKAKDPAPPPTPSATFDKAQALFSYAAAATVPAKAGPAKRGKPTPVAPTWENPAPKANLPPPRPSLVLSITNHTTDRTLRSTAGVLAPTMVPVCNAALASAPTFASVRVSAAQWTPKGNLVIFAGPETTRAQLFAASHLLTSAVAASLPDRSAVTSRLNVRWDKVLINGVPTGISKEHLNAHSPAECLQEIIANNPAFRTLKVMQLPSWVRPPRLFQPHSMSSLVMAFEDPDGTIVPSLTRGRQLFAFGACTLLKKWKQRNPPSPTKRRQTGTVPCAGAPEKAPVLALTIPADAELATEAAPALRHHRSTPSPPQPHHQHTPGPSQAGRPSAPT